MDKGEEGCPGPTRGDTHSHNKPQVGDIIQHMKHETHTNAIRTAAQPVSEHAECPAMKSLYAAS